MPISHGNFSLGSGSGSGGNSSTYPATVATTSNINLASSPATIDGFTLINGSSVILVKNQTPNLNGNPNNGLYLFNGTGNPLTRFTGYTSWTSFIGLTVVVGNGVTQGGTNWLSNAMSGGTLGTTNLGFTQTSGIYTASNGITLTGSNFTLTTSSAPASQFANGVSGGNLIYAQPTLNDIKTNIVSKNSNYSMTITDDIIYVDCSSSAVTITLLASASFSNSNISYVFIKTDNSINNLTLLVQGSDLMINGTDDISLVTHVQDQANYILADSVNLNWRVL